MLSLDSVEPLSFVLEMENAIIYFGPSTEYMCVVRISLRDSCCVLVIQMDRDIDRLWQSFPYYISLFHIHLWKMFVYGTCEQVQQSE